MHQTLYHERQIRILSHPHLTGIGSKESQLARRYSYADNATLLGPDILQTFGRAALYKYPSIDKHRKWKNYLFERTVIMSLEPGTYTIKSTNGFFVGRHIVEDSSYVPKKVLLLPENFPNLPKWEITKASDDSSAYILKTRGSPASNINGLLFGVLLSETGATEWKIKAQPQHGKNLYTISFAGEGDGWVSPGQEFEQIVVRPLIAMPSDPPRFPLNELFEFTWYNFE